MFAKMKINRPTHALIYDHEKIQIYAYAYTYNS